MTKKKYKGWDWYPFKRLDEGKGFLGKILKKYEDWEPFERLGNPEMRKIRPLKNIFGTLSDLEDTGTNRRAIELDWDELPDDVRNYVKKQAEKTDNTVEDVLASKPIKNYILSRLGGEKGK